ncbi:Aminotransferase class-III [Colletotrichum higginsianum IMI 349063]|uniref:Aminotransferase class-III n=2 Tax=Colletotrichum higginsianum TaxID=80884 RepID=A0A1B7XYE3_COLHI|nr:Aminotransferase class-III [Colletotrichum higginsianum IMI 349063]OBR04751.1 Aminotransferase class-III [Colletotrichum higginsianum IMI 349063]TIC93525.1 putative aminotransferase [Colletotrichum higginsianum]
MAPARDDDLFTPAAACQNPTSLKPNGAEGRLMHRSLVQHPSMVESASGVYLNLANGQKVIDACGGAAVAIIGHGNEEVIQAITDQARKVSYVHTQAYTTEPAEELANVILDGNPHGLEKAFFVCSGSEAVESALKLARQYHYEKGQPQRLHLIGRRQAYHGNTMATMSISTVAARKVPYHGFGYPHVSFVSPAYAYQYQRKDESEDEFTARLLAEIEAEFQRVGPGNVIAFVAETMVGATAGCVAPPVGYLAGVRQICDKHGALLILDEVMCGTGRTGTFFAFEQEGVVPDIVTVAKGLGGGYGPIAGVLMHEKVVAALRQGSNAFNHGHTYQAHPIACAAALAVQKILRRDGLVARCAQLGNKLEALLRAELINCRSVGDIRGRGLFWGVEFVKDRDTKETFDPKTRFGIRVQERAFEKGVALYPGAGTVDGSRGDHVLLAPPYTTTEEQLLVVCRVFREAVEEIEAETL